MKPFVPLGERDVLVFEHVPKTAGNTLRQVLRRRFGDRLVMHNSMKHPVRRAERLREELLSERPPRAISSHIGYGLHERLPDTFRYHHITFLRDPVDRTISQYHYAIERGRLAEGTTLLEFCRVDARSRVPLRAHNLQTTFLSGLRARGLLGGEPPQPEELDEALLERAKANLDAFAAVGLVSRFDESLLLLASTFGWPLLDLRSVPVNVGKRRPKRATLTAEERAAVEAANGLDVELYRHAERRFEALLAERVPDAEERLRSLARLNRAYGPIAPAVEKLGTLRRRVRRSLRA